MSEYRAESTRANSLERAPEVAPMRLSTENQFGAVDITAMAAASSSATDALVRGGALPGLTVGDYGSNGAAAAPAAAADGSLDAHVKAGDNLWRIARGALSQGHEEGYRPSNQEVLAAVGAIARENHMQNPDLIHAGDVIHIPAELLQQHQAQAQDDRLSSPPGERGVARSAPADQPVTPTQADQPAPAGDQPNYRMHGEVHNASHQFGNAVLTEFEHLPQNVRRLLAESGIKLVVAGRVTEFDPSLAGTDVTQANGMFDAGKHAIVMVETHFDPSRGYVPNGDIHGTFGAMAAHAVDSSLNNMSHSDEFKRALQTDMASMSEAGRTKFASLLQDNDRSREAAFSDIFTTINGSATNNDEGLTVLRDFSNVKALMQARLAQLPS